MAEFRLSESAERDVVQLLADTVERFGETGRRRYQALLVAGLRDIAADPSRPASIARPELGDAVRSYHLRHRRDRGRCADGLVRRPRHLLLYRVVRPDLIGIGRVLHDSMEIERHLPVESGAGW